jgi:hypothetical protein
MTNGYMDRRYAASLMEFGTPQELPKCRGWILRRQIPDSVFFDGMGCYPLFACENWGELIVDLENETGDLISLALVTDPFGCYDEELLRKCFRNVVFPFKEHFIADLSIPIGDFVTKHHRYYARRSLKEVEVEEVRNPEEFTDEMSYLYTKLIQRHNLRGIKAFSKKAFAEQLRIPGTVVLKALHQGMVVGAIIWLLGGEVCYANLGGCSEIGYKLGAWYALYWRALEFFRGKGRWIDWGGVAGVGIKNRDGLSEFKRGWSTGTRTTYFCGRIFNRDRYLELGKAKGLTDTDYFPCYRKGEF